MLSPGCHGWPSKQLTYDTQMRMNFSNSQRERMGPPTRLQNAIPRDAEQKHTTANEISADPSSHSPLPRFHQFLSLICPYCTQLLVNKGDPSRDRSGVNHHLLRTILAAEAKYHSQTKQSVAAKVGNHHALASRDMDANIQLKVNDYVLK